MKMRSWHQNLVNMRHHSLSGWLTSSQYNMEQRHHHFFVTSDHQWSTPLLIWLQQKIREARAETHAMIMATIPEADEGMRGVGGRNQMLLLKMRYLTPNLHLSTCTWCS